MELAKKLDPQKLQKRTLSAALFTPPALFIIWYGGWLFGLMVLAFLALALWEWWKMSRKFIGSDVNVYKAGGILYILFCFYSFFILGNELWNNAALALILIAPAGDVGAYFAGKIIGGVKMIPSLSPNKTWAGFGGALGGSIVMAFLCWLFGLHVETLSFVLWGGLFIGISGQAGDLLVSWSKRKAGVKDTGWLFPGHGGVLDRIDSLLLSAPVFMILTTALNHG